MSIFRGETKGIKAKLNNEEDITLLLLLHHMLVLKIGLSMYKNLIYSQIK